MKSTLIRATAADIATDGRNLAGMALYWNQASDVTDDGQTFYPESFTARSVEKTLKERGAIPLPLGVYHPWQPGSPGNTALFDEPVGSVRFHSTREGLAFRARIQQTPTGDQVLEMVNDGELTDVSIGFVPYKSENVDGVTVRTEIALLELSLAPVGTAQHQGAQVLAVRANDRRTPRRDMLDKRAGVALWLPRAS